MTEEVGKRLAEFASRHLDQTVRTAIGVQGQKVSYSIMDETHRGSSTFTLHEPATAALRRIEQDDAQRRFEAYEREVQEHVERMNALRTSFGEDRADGAVVRIERQFSPDGKVYLYAAIRAEGRWYLTGASQNTPQGANWDELTLWLIAGSTATVTELASGWYHSDASD